MVDMGMFAHRPVLFTNLAGLFLGFAMFSQFIGVAYLAQMPKELTGYGFGASVLRASVEYLLPTTLISLLAAQFGGILVGRIGARFTLAVGAVFGVAGVAWLTLAHDTSASIILAGLLIGVAISFGYAAMPALIVASVPHHQTGIANGLNSISRSVGSAIASAVITSLLASKTIEHLPAGAPALPAESQFTLSFAIAGVAFVLIVAVALVGLTRGAAQEYTVEKKAAATDDAAADEAVAETAAVTS
jgi:MFS family permease